MTHGTSIRSRAVSGGQGHDDVTLLVPLVADSQRLLEFDASLLHLKNKQQVIVATIEERSGGHSLATNKPRTPDGANS